MALSLDIVTYIRQQIEAYLNRWPQKLVETGGLPVAALPPGGDTGEGYTPAEHSHTEFYDAHKIWNRLIESAEPDVGDGLVWDGTQFALGGVGGGGSGFKAFLTINTPIDSSTNITAFGNEIYDTDGTYDSSSCVWTPPAGLIALIGRTHLDVNLDIVTAFVKNGTVAYIKHSGRYTHEGDAYTDFFWQDLANGTDVYELAITGDSGTLLSLNTYWAGIAIGGNSSIGGGGGVPSPFVYLVDDDGAYLVDSDGAYLFEDL